MSHEIILEQAAEMAFQAEMVCALLEGYPEELQSSEINAVATLIKRLSGRAAAWLAEEVVQREKKV